MTEEEMAKERFTAHGFSMDEETKKAFEEFRRRIREDIMGDKEDGNKDNTANSRNDDRQIE